LPVGSYEPNSVRRAGQSDVLVVPTADVRRCADSKRLGPGACIVTENPLTGRCFTVAELVAGRAFEVRGERLLGLVPDGWSAVDLSVDDRTSVIPVSHNVVDETIPGLTAGEPIAIHPHDPPGAILILNETRVEGLAGVTRDELSATFTNRIGVDTGHDTQRKTTVVETSKRAEALGRKVAEKLGAPLERSAQLRPWFGFEADVIVHVGTDRMR
jgi:hypothetical protein